LPALDFNKTGTFSLGYKTLVSNTTGGDGGNLSSNIQTNADAQINVKYYYSAASTPEPLSMVLLGSGLIAVGLISKVKRRA
ncbi:MAG TPA: choice-of-anchor E domain-containing protein, partial [Bryobacteraceae bacterium]|nr:choice-of-anchor E domain-containing protein [Bryobacteraceae bacterium]